MSDLAQPDVAPDETARLLALRWPVHASLSPDGERLLLTTTEIEPGADHETLRLSVVRISDGAETEVPAASDGGGDGGSTSHSAVWAPDGRGVAWCVEFDDGTSAVMVADAVDGTARLLEASRGVAGPAVWSPDGSRLAITARPGTAVDRSRPYRWTRPIAAFDGLGPLDDPPQVRVIEIATDEGRWLTADGWRWSMPRWSPDGDRLCAVAGIDPTGRQAGQHVHLLDADPADPADGDAAGPTVPDRVDVPGGRSATAAWLPDGRLAVVVGEPRDRGLGSDAELWLVGPNASRQVPVQCLVGDVYGDSPAALAELYELLVLVDRHGGLVLRCGSNGRMWVARIDAAALDDPGAVPEPTVLADGRRSCAPVAVAGDTLIVTTQSATEPAELVVIDAAGVERRLTRFAAPMADAGGVPAPPVPSVEVRRFQLRTAEGWPLDAWFAAPAGAIEHGDPLPTVLVVHGGPHYAYGEMFSIDVHALCAAGYAAVYANPRGSMGCGAEFARACHGDWADGPAGDLLAVVDHVVAAGWADPDRLAVSGMSYGGYMSAWLAATTTRFRAAVIENPVTDLAAMWATSDIGISFFEANFGGAPYEVPDTYRMQSPLWRAHECRTPCLFVVGDDDRRCPPAQAWGMHRVLCSVGTPSEVMVLPGSSHEGSTYGPPAARLAQNAAMVGWLQRWL